MDSIVLCNFHNDVALQGDHSYMARCAFCKQVNSTLKKKYLLETSMGVWILDCRILCPIHNYMAEVVANVMRKGALVF